MHLLVTHHMISTFDKKQKLVKQVPLESMCLETDAPALGPEKQVRQLLVFSVINMF